MLSGVEAASLSQSPCLHRLPVDWLACGKLFRLIRIRVPGACSTELVMLSRVEPATLSLSPCRHKLPFGGLACGKLFRLIKIMVPRSPFNRTRHAERSRSSFPVSVSLSASAPIRLAGLWQAVQVDKDKGAMNLFNRSRHAERSRSGYPVSVSLSA
jgi:hypothetical protein